MLSIKFIFFIRHYLVITHFYPGLSIKMFTSKLLSHSSPLFPTPLFKLWLTPFRTGLVPVWHMLIGINWSFWKLVRMCIIFYKSACVSHTFSIDINRNGHDIADIYYFVGKCVALFVAVCHIRQYVAERTLYQHYLISLLTLVLLNLALPNICKQCRSGSVGFCQLILIYTVCHSV